MLVRKRHPFIFILNILIFFAVILFDSNVTVDISIKNATPMLALPLLTAYSVFAPLKRSALAGLLAGALIDSVSANTYCFNTICFFLIGIAVGLAANNLFNKNIRAATAITLLVSFAYYTAYWLVFMAFGVGIQNSLIYLLGYGLPSALYSSAFIFPFYLIQKYFEKIRLG